MSVSVTSVISTGALGVTGSSIFGSETGGSDGNGGSSTLVYCGVSLCKGFALDTGVASAIGSLFSMIGISLTGSIVCGW